MAGSYRPPTSRCQIEGCLGAIRGFRPRRDRTSIHALNDLVAIVGVDSICRALEIRVENPEALGVRAGDDLPHPESRTRIAPVGRFDDLESGDIRLGQEAIEVKNVLRVPRIASR